MMLWAKHAEEFYLCSVPQLPPGQQSQSREQSQDENHFPGSPWLDGEQCPAHQGSSTTVRCYMGNCQLSVELTTPAPASKRIYIAAAERGLCQPALCACTAAIPHSQCTPRTSELARAAHSKGTSDPISQSKMCVHAAPEAQHIGTAVAAAFWRSSGS